MLCGWVAFSNEELAARRRPDRHLLEERLHAVIVSLAPAVEGMMMALGAGDADTEKHLRQAAGRLAGPGNDTMERRLRHLRQRSLGSQHFADKAVIRLV